MSADRAVLIVEDDEGLRYALSKVMEKIGMRVDVAAHGSEAIAYINDQANSYCCVLLDMILPTVHGSSIVTHIARVAPKLPVVAITGFPDRVLFADPADRHVVKAIFTKPVEPADVAAYVKSLCSRARESK